MESYLGQTSIDWSLQEIEWALSSNIGKPSLPYNLNVMQLRKVECGASEILQPAGEPDSIPVLTQ